MAMLTKNQIIKAIKGLPDNFSIDELFDRVILLNKIEAGIEQADRGETYTTAQAKKKLKKWLK